MFLAVQGIAALLFGLGFLLAPESSLRMYGVPTEPHHLMLSRYLGSEMIAFGIVSLLARGTQDPAAVRALLVAGGLSNLVSAGLSVASVGTLLNGMGWMSAVIFLAFGAGGGYYLFKDTPRGHPRSA